MPHYLVSWVLCGASVKVTTSIIMLSFSSSLKAVTADLLAITPSELGVFIEKRMMEFPQFRPIFKHDACARTCSVDRLASRALRRSMEALRD